MYIVKYMIPEFSQIQLCTAREEKAPCYLLVQCTHIGFQYIIIIIN